MPKPKGVVAPPRTLAPEAEGAGGGRSRARISASGCEAGFYETSMATPKGSYQPEGPPNRRRKRESPRDRRRQGDGARLYAPGRDPAGRFEEASASEDRSGRPARPSGGAAIRNGDRRRFRAPAGSEGSGPGFGPIRDRRDVERLRPGDVPGRARRPRPNRFFEGRPERLRPRCEPRTRSRLRPGSDPPRDADGGISVLPRRPAGIGEGLSGLSRNPPGPERGFTAFAAGSGESGRGSRPAAIPKPPSERWPRHPATAVKAGTSGGRWRHRPPLSLGGTCGFHAQAANLTGRRFQPHRLHHQLRQR